MIELHLAQIEFEPRDVWVGVYWDLERAAPAWSFLRLYICVIPMLPLHICFIIWKR